MECLNVQALYKVNACNLLFSARRLLLPALCGRDAGRFFTFNACSLRSSLSQLAYHLLHIFYYIPRMFA